MVSDGQHQRTDLQREVAQPVQRAVGRQHEHDQHGEYAAERGR